MTKFILIMTVWSPQIGDQPRVAIDVPLQSNLSINECVELLQQHWFWEPYKCVPMPKEPVFTNQLDGDIPHGRES